MSDCVHDRQCLSLDYPKYIFKRCIIILALNKYCLVQAEIPSLGTLFILCHNFFIVFFLFFFISVLFDILVVCNNSPNSVRMFFVAWFNTISYFYTVFQKSTSQTLHMVPDLGKQSPRPCFEHFCHISFFTNFIKCIFV